eukprot:827407-Pyramimonas_sp.AAC.1
MDVDEETDHEPDSSSPPSDPEGEEGQGSNRTPAPPIQTRKDERNPDHHSGQMGRHPCQTSSRRLWGERATHLPDTPAYGSGQGAEG